MLESSLVAVARDGGTSTATVIGLISVAATETAGVMIANPPAGFSTTAAEETVGVMVGPTVTRSRAFIAAATLGMAETVTNPDSLRPNAADTVGATLMNAPPMISAHHPVTGLATTGTGKGSTDQPVFEA